MLERQEEEKGREKTGEKEERGGTEPTAELGKHKFLPLPPSASAAPQRPAFSRNCAARSSGAEAEERKFCATAALCVFYWVSVLRITDPLTHTNDSEEPERSTF